MAEKQHLDILKQGVGIWNAWRLENPETRPDLGAAVIGPANMERFNLEGVNLAGSYLMGACLEYANLEAAALMGAHFIGANLKNANFIGANLMGTNLVEADLRGAKFERANLEGANLGLTNLAGTDLGKAKLNETILNNVDLSTTMSLNDCRHLGPSCIDYRTIARSKNVPISFWRGCGLPDLIIDYMPSLTEDAIQYNSCFISYSSRDQEFADRLHADLQDNGVRCWFAPHDLLIGAKTWDGIDEAIRTRDKVLLILSKGAIASDWVEDEVTTAFAEERRRNEPVLFPVRLDNSVMETGEPWAGKLRDNRNIGDFTKWKEHDAYKATLDRVLRDLKTSR